MNSNGLVLPQSVVTWLSDTAVRMSVNSILAIEDGDLPPGLLWEELRTYYEARAVAQLTRAEWAIALFDLWTFVWGAQISSEWHARSSDELQEKDDWLTEEDLWDNKSITVSYRRGNRILYTALELYPDRVVIAFGLEPEIGDTPLIVGQPSPFIWAEGKKQDWADWNYYSKGGSIVDDAHVLPNLREAARKALEVCESQF